MNRLEERLKFVRFWAKFVKSTDPKVWSSQQKELIDSILSSANQDVELYLKIKKIMLRGDLKKKVGFKKCEK